MFVRKSRFDEALRRVATLAQLLQQEERNHRMLVAKWNELVQRINRKGGEEFLSRGQIDARAPSSPFSTEEIRTLIKLCHPDKHGGDKAAEAITAKLLSMRK